jgi:hypothetical protein
MHRRHFITSTPGVTFMAANNNGLERADERPQYQNPRSVSTTSGVLADLSGR